MQITHRFQWMRPRWARDDHPIYHLETQRRVQNRALMALRWGCLPGVFAVTGLLILTVSVVGLVSGSLLEGSYGTVSILMVATWLLLLVQVAAGAMVNVMVIAQAAPAISGEIELQSWRLLRTTTLPVREIILAKLAAVFEHLKLPFVGLVILRAVTAGTGLLFYLYTLHMEYLDGLSWIRFLREGKWLPVGAATLVGLSFFAAQPAIQFALNGTLGMLASVMAPSRSRALASGLIGRLAGWVGSILFNVGAIYGLGFLITNWAEPYSAPLPMFRDRPAPNDDLVLWVVCAIICLYLVVALAVQIGFIGGSLRFIERRARHLGA